MSSPALSVGGTPRSLDGPLQIFACSSASHRRVGIGFSGRALRLFHEGLGADVTAIIEMTKPVAVVLPILLTIAAIGSQFSAAVADDSGAGGLLEDITHQSSRSAMPIC